MNLPFHTVGSTLGDMLRAETAHQRYLLERYAEAKARRDDAEADMATYAHSLGLTHHPDFPLYQTETEHA